MTNPLYSIEQLPTTDQAAIREFNDRYIAAIGAVPPSTWSDLGDLIPTASPLVTFPISSLSLKYLQDEGEARFKTLLSKSFDIKAEKVQTGIEADFLQLTQQVFAYRAWSQGPSRMVMAEARHRNRSIATLLEAGASTTWVDGKNFFDAAHLSDLTNSGSTAWSNYQSSGKDVTDLAKVAEEVTLMQGVLDENGEKMGIDPDTILVPTEKYEGLKNKLAQALILDSTGSAAVTNFYAGRFKVVHVPELSDVNDWYLVDSKMLASHGLAPWISLRYTTPNPAMQLQTFDTSSDFFKNTGRIKVSSNIWYGFALGFPHCIRKVVGS